MSLRPLSLLLSLPFVLTAPACRPGDVLSVPPPAGVLAGSTLGSQEGAESALNGAKGQLFNAFDGGYYIGLQTWIGLLADETSFSGFSSFNAARFASVDARITTYGAGFNEGSDIPWANLLKARSSMLLATPLLAAYEPASGRARLGEAYALTGYTELLIAESYCAGTPLDAVVPGGGIRFGAPLTTDSLLGAAAAHFDSALAVATGNDSITSLASVGLGRALLDRGQYAAAASAVASVPPGFIYDVVLEPNENAPPFAANLWGVGIQFSSDAIFNVADGEGGNGLNFVSAHDPRLTLDSTTYPTADGTPWRVPVKFEANLAYMPLATGVEAALIGAEAALQTNADWLGDLNALRTDGTFTVPAPGDTVYGAGTGGVVGLAPLTDPGTSDAQIDLLFRERAFWLFGTGTRLGDLRRLVRQYGRDQGTVFPTGPYPNGHNSNLPSPLPSYGTDVDLTLPTSGGLLINGLTIANPNYKGCLTPTSSA